MKPLVLFCLLFTLKGLCQQDTTYFDKSGQRSTRKEAAYYRVIYKMGDGFTIYDRYTSNNNVYMTTECSLINPEIRNGNCAAYEANGALIYKGQYTGNEESGRWVYMYNHGKDSSVVEFRQGGPFYMNRGHYVELQGRKQFVLNEGAGKPPVVFITGLGSPQSVFINVLNAVKQHQQVFAYDRAGLGQSERLYNERRVDTMAAELNQLLVKENINGPCLLVAHSLGGFVARCFTAMYPAKVAGIVFVDPACETCYKLSMDARTTRGDKAKLRKEYESYLNDAEMSGIYNDEAKYTFDNDTAGYSTNGRLVKDLQLPAGLPVTLLLSTRFDKEPPLRPGDQELRVNYLKNQYPQAKVKLTGNSGHFIQLEEPALVIEAIDEMVKEISSKH